MLSLSVVSGAVKPPPRPFNNLTMVEAVATVSSRAEQCCLTAEQIAKAEQY
jgi:hypothetical protein